MAEERIVKCGGACVYVHWKVSNIAAPEDRDPSCLMCIVMFDNSITVCAESTDDMRYAVEYFQSHIAAKCSHQFFSLYRYAWNCEQWQTQEMRSYASPIGNCRCGSFTDFFAYSEC